MSLSQKSTNQSIASDKQIGRFVDEYRKIRVRGWSFAVQELQSGPKRFFRPFVDWRSPYISKTLKNTREALAALDAWIASSSVTPDELAVASLTAKNRAEVISEKSDFYPMFSALLAVSIATGAIFLNVDLVMKMFLAGFAWFFVLTSALIRLDTRAQVAYLKEIANMMDHRLKYPAPTTGVPVEHPDLLPSTGIDDLAGVADSPAADELHSVGQEKLG